MQKRLRSSKQRWLPGLRVSTTSLAELGDLGLNNGAIVVESQNVSIVWCRYLGVQVCRIDHYQEWSADLEDLCSASMSKSCGLGKSLPSTKKTGINTRSLSGPQSLWCLLFSWICRRRRSNYIAVLDKCSILTSVSLCALPLWYGIPYHCFTLPDGWKAAVPCENPWKATTITNLFLFEPNRSMSVLFTVSNDSTPVLHGRFPQLPPSTDQA